MAAFFKMVLHGLLYAIAFPFFIVALAIYAIYCSIMFLYELIRSLFVFFSGGTPFGDLKEDVEAKKILLERQNNPQAVASTPAQNIYIFQQKSDSKEEGPHPLDFGEIDFTRLNQIDNKSDKEGGNK